MSVLERMKDKGDALILAFVSDQERAFRRRAGRNRRLAEWACDLTGEDGQAYRRILLDAEFARNETAFAEWFVLEKIRNDLAGYGIKMPAGSLEDVARRLEADAAAED